jgi:hypothetical protein
MTVESTGENLIFLISQPRSGSTLLQKILGAHGDISTSVEPWLLLPLVSVLKKETSTPQYYDLHRHINITEFLDSVHDGRRLYLDGVSALMCRLYNAAMEQGKGIFLDKTPRYYLIVPELAEIFPEAKFIFLFRNPLSVLASMHSTWGSVMGLFNSGLKRDLVDAPNLLVEGKQSLGERAYAISYESMIENPGQELSKLCDWLSIPFQDRMLEYGTSKNNKWQLGDQTSVYEHDRPVTGSLDKWTDFVRSAQNWKYADDYLKYLGSETVHQLGYSYTDLRDKLDSYRPSAIARLVTLPLFFSMKVHNIARKSYRRVVYKEAVF